MSQRLTPSYYRAIYIVLRRILLLCVRIASKALSFACFLFLIIGCTGTKFLKEGETFYTGAEIQIDPKGKISGQKKVKSSLQNLATPKPNSTFLGSRPAVWFYFIAGEPKREKGFRYFIKNKLGSPPVLLKDVVPIKMAKILESQLNNDGYFRSTVSHKIETRGKRSKVLYTVSLQQPYRLRTISFLVFDTANSSFLKKLKKESLLKEKQRYSLERLQVEQQRIEALVQNLGFYYFDDRYLLFEADSTVGKNEIDVTLTFEPNMPDKATRIYKVKTVNVFPNYILGNDSIAVISDTIKVNGFNYIDNKKMFRPEIITDVINLKPDSIYRMINHDYSLSRLMSLKTFKFVSIKFRDDKTDSAVLHANIYLTPLLKKSLRFQVQGVSKSNNFVGPGFEMIFTNRNFLRGAEMWRVKVNGAYESQISRQQAGALNSIEFGAESGLSIPRFITPFRMPYSSAKYLPQTQLKLGYNFQQRLQYFRLTSFNVACGYIWRETTLKTHELFPVDVSFVRSSKTSPEFDALLKQNPILSNSFQNQFIIGSRYSFTLNTQMREDVKGIYRSTEEKKSNIYFNGSIDLSGNILNLLQSTNTSKEEPFEMFSAPYSQFVKSDIDFRYYFQFNKQSKLATRIVMGAGYAYGNSTNLPYIKQFAIGGSNSLRAFPARSVGPGTYNVRTDTAISMTTYFIDQRGDIKLEANIEYRFDILKALKGAVFFDAGNIWLLKEDELRKGGKFNKDTFLNEIAAGTGVGIRYDFNFFILRFDVAFPVRKPFLVESNRWVIDEIDFGSKDWRRKNLILNIAIGYPF